MDITILDKQKMDVIRELAKVNVEFSDAKTTLNAMKENVQDFLKERDTQDKARLDNLLKESKELVNEIQNNHSQVTTFFNEVKSFSGFLVEFHEALQVITQSLRADSDEFVELVKREEMKLADTRHDIQKQLQIISSEKLEIEKSKQGLEKEKRLIESRQAQIKSALQVIKKEKIV